MMPAIHAFAPHSVKEDDVCRNIIFHDDDDPPRLVRTQEDLVKMIGLANMVLQTGRDYCGEACLCPVDLQATAEKAGWVHSQNRPDGRSDPLKDHWTRKEIDLAALLVTWRGILRRQETKEAGSVRISYAEMRALVELAGKALPGEAGG